MHRFEDDRLLRGFGNFLEDHDFEGLHAVFVRSPLAHARIRRIGRDAARRSPGCRAVYTAQDFAAAGVRPMVCSRPFESFDGTPFHAPVRHVLAADTVRFVGDPVAVVIADTPANALAAAERVDVDYDERPAVLRPADSDEVAVTAKLGDPAATVAAFAAAAHVVRIERGNNRVSALPLETRSAVGRHDASEGMYTLETQSQGVHMMRTLVADTLGVDESRLRVVTPGVGGSFGMKLVNYPEQTAVLVAARLTGEPVRWVSTRGEALMSDTQARDHESTAEMALDADGRILGLRVLTHGNLGAYASSIATSSPVVGFGRTLVNVYRVPVLDFTTRAAYTHTVPTDAFRGAGKPEAVHLMERLIDAAALATGIDRIRLRELNLVTPEEMPYHAANGEVWDCGDFPRAMREALSLADWEAFPARRERSTAAGRLRGLGLGMYLHTAGAGITETSRIEVDADGRLLAYVGAQDIGQAHATTFAQLLAEHLGVAANAVTLVQGDTDRLPARGAATGGSNSLQTAGATLLRASDRLVEQLRPHAAMRLEAAAADIEFGAGEFTVAGTDLRVPLLALGAQVRATTPGDCSAEADFEGNAMTVPNGAYVCEVEVDPETGAVELCRFSGVDDAGRRLNPAVVDGQLHGSIAHGLGQAMMERVYYDPESGQLVTGSLMDYAVPRAEVLCDFDLLAADVPTGNNPLGAKGVGELGCLGAPGAFMNAVCDAISTQDIEMPATPERVWRALASR